MLKEEHLQDANAIFCDIHEEGVLAGQLLGGCIGDEVGIRQYISSMIDICVTCVELLAEAARSYPQSAYAALMHSLLCKWSYIEWVVEGSEEEYCHLCNAIHHVLTPAMLGRERF